MEENNRTDGGNDTVTRSRWRSGVFSFLAGALVFGSLMFAADNINLFTGNHSPGATSVYGNGQSAGSASTAGSFKAAALDVARPGGIAQMVEKANPAVVLIETYVKPSKSRRSLLDDPWYRQFFGDPNDSGDNGGPSGAMQQTGAGSGFIFDRSGYILTNEHVISGADEVRVTVQGHGTTFTAKVLGHSAELDLAVLKIEGDQPFAVLPLAANTDQVKVGDWVVAIGNPYGFQHTVTAGVLSAKEREIPITDGQGQSRTYKSLLQTDAAINPGNSGGPLLDLNGEVVGINTAVNAQAQGMGFAIPINTVQKVLDKLVKNEEIPKVPVPFLGVTPADITAQIQRELGLKGANGSLVVQVSPGTPAYTAGIKQWDVITSVDGAAVKNAQELRNKIAELKIGSKAKIGLIRDGKSITAEVTIGDKNVFEQSGADKVFG